VKAGPGAADVGVEMLLSLHRAAIAALPAGELARETLLDGRFLLHRGAGYSVHYAPFDHVNTAARIALVGIAPGWEQMRLGYETARDRLRAGAGDQAMLAAVKRNASLSGMRTRLAQWLDGIGAGRALGLPWMSELFEGRTDLLHTTSAVRYPVLCDDGRTWSGLKPAMAEPALREITRTLLAAELAQIPGALVVPLGAAVEEALRDLVAQDRLEAARCLFGFPHPSGANVSGPQRYREAQPRLRAQVARWAAAPDADAVRLPDRSALQELMVESLSALGGRAHRRAAREKAIALGAFSAAQLELPPPASKASQYPSQLEYQLDWALDALLQQGRVRKLGPGEWALAERGL
jgi:hypothetical protein